MTTAARPAAARTTRTVTNRTVTTRAGGSSTTRTLLTAGVVTAPLWSAVALGQAATREGFDLTQHPLSVLSTGDLGWLQITNFVVAGVLTIVGAAGLRRVLPGPWAARLMTASGLGQIAAGMLVLDPVAGFPTGSPGVAPAMMSWHAAGHLLAGAVSFLGLLGACLVMGAYFRRVGRRGLATGSVLAGVAVVLGNGWAMSGGMAGPLTLAVGVITGMLWMSLVAARLRRTA